MVNLKINKNKPYPGIVVFGQIFLWICLYATTATFLDKYFSGSAGESPIWIPSGIGLAILFIYGVRFWPAILIAATLGEVGGGHPLIQSMFFALGALIGNLFAYYSLKLLHIDRNIKKIKDYLLFVLASAFAALISAFINVQNLKISGSVLPDIYSIFTEWYIGDFFGMAFVAPIILILRQPWPKWTDLKKAIFVILTLLIFFFGQMVFFGWFSEFINFTDRATLIFFAVAIMAFYFGRHGASLIYALVLVQSTLSTVYGNGFFGPDMMAQPGPMYIWVYLGTMSIVGLFISLAVKSFESKNEELKEIADQILKTEGYFKEMVTSTPIVILAFELISQKIEFVNPFCKKILGYSEADITNTSAWWRLIFPDESYRDKALKSLNVTSQDGRVSTAMSTPIDVEMRCFDGSFKTINLGIYFTNSNVVLYGQDVTDQKKTENLLKVTSVVHQAMGEAVVVLDENDNIKIVNEAFRTLTQFTEDELVGQTFFDYLQPAESSASLHNEIFSSINSLGKWEGQLLVVTKDGAKFPRYVSLHSVLNESGSIFQKVALISEVTDLRKSQELIFSQANFDPLTQLPNRRLFLEYLDKSISDAQIRKEIVAVVYLDIDNFKGVNDSRGHDFGDQLLVIFAKRLRDVLRTYDVVSRIGGDEFILLLKNINTREEVEALMQRITSRLSDSFTINNEVIYTTTSLGVALFPEHSVHPKSLLLAADQAMYVAKSLGRNNFQFFSSALKDEAHYLAGMLSDLRQAMELNQFELFYQPIVDVHTHAILHAEALLRWRKSSGEVVLPGSFIDESEESGFIIEIGEWVFQQTLKFLSSIQYDANFSIAINVSALQFNSSLHSAADWLSRMSAMGIDPKHITLEITERIMLQRSERVLSKVAALQEAGCKFSIDDFGTGYSSIGALKNFKFDYVKIDSAFIKDLTKEGPDSTMTLAMISMAKALGLKSIAEGVETSEQARILQVMNCDLGQGYFYKEPVPQEEFRMLLAGANKEKS